MKKKKFEKKFEKKLISEIGTVFQPEHSSNSWPTREKHHQHEYRHFGIAQNPAHVLHDMLRRHAYIQVHEVGNARGNGQQNSKQVKGGRKIREAVPLASQTHKVPTGRWKSTHTNL